MVAQLSGGSGAGKVLDSALILAILRSMPREETRIEAATAGRKTYLGSECRVCDERERYTSTGNCKACVARRANERHDRIRELLKKAAGDEADT